MQKITKVYKLLLLLSIMFILTGCWDREEVEDNAYVIGLGLDKSKEENKIKVTMQIANPEVGSVQGGGGSIEKPKEVITFDANDFITAKSTANAIITRDISYQLLKIIVVSEELARDPKFFNWLNDALNEYEIRLNTYLAVSKEKASEYFLNLHPKLETRPHKYFQYMIEHGVNNGLIPDSTLFRFIKTTQRGTDLFLAMYTTAKKEKHPKIKREDEYIAGQVNVKGDVNKTQFIGSAVFKNGVMINKLNGQDTRIVNVLDDTTNISDILINIPDPFTDNKQFLALRMLKNAKNKVKMNVKDPTPKITITIPLNFEILSNPSNVSYTNTKNQQIMKKHLEKRVSTSYEKFLKKTQTELKGAPFPLSIHARKYFATNKEYYNFNWKKSYPKAKIIIKPKIEIVNYGDQIKRKEQ